MALFDPPPLTSARAATRSSACPTNWEPGAVTVPGRSRDSRPRLRPACGVRGVGGVRAQLAPGRRPMSPSLRVVQAGRREPLGGASRFGAWASRNRALPAAAAAVSVLGGAAARGSPRRPLRSVRPHGPDRLWVRHGGSASGVGDADALRQELASLRPRSPARRQSAATVMATSAPLAAESPAPAATPGHAPRRRRHPDRRPERRAAPQLPPGARRERAAAAAETCSCASARSPATSISSVGRIWCRSSRASVASTRSASRCWTNPSRLDGSAPQ